MKIAKTSMIWQIFRSYIILVLVTLLTLMYAVNRVLDQAQQRDLDQNLEAHAQTMLLALQQHFPDDPEGVRRLFAQHGKTHLVRFTLISPTGVVLADSELDPARSDRLADRPEVRQALQTGRGYARRISPQTNKEMRYVARTVEVNGEVRAVLRVARSMQQARAVTGEVRRVLLWGGLGMGLLTVFSSLLISRRIARPLEQLADAARAYARGHLQQVLPEGQTREMQELIEALHDMASQVQSRIDAVNNQARKEAAILSSMAEGVLAVDAKGHILLINEAARQLLRLKDAAPLTTFSETVRHVELNDMVRQICHGASFVRRDVAVNGAAPRLLQVCAVEMKDAKDEGAGVVLVLEDVTQLRRLEHVRKDFVSNVSHELRTPITSILGFVETLKEGGVEDAGMRQRFLSIVERQTRHLQAVVDNLLQLSRVEQAEKEGTLPRQSICLRQLFEQAVEISTAQWPGAAEHISVSCEAHLQIKVNEALMEQVVVNLIDNALVYGGAEVSIRLSGKVTEAGLVLEVCDNGPGISSEHHERLFERFYRIDAGRTRSRGGTGLGLAIVKHIIQAHAGTISVESRLGKGACFRMVLPPDAVCG